MPDVFRPGTLVGCVSTFPRGDYFLPPKALLVWPEDVAAARGLTVSQVLPVGAKPEKEAPPEPTLQQTVTTSDEPAVAQAEAETEASETLQQTVTSSDEAAQEVAAEEPQETESGEDQDQASS